MTQYQAKSNKSLLFELKKEDSLIGKIVYKSWFKFNAEIELADHSKYQVEPKGFWGTTIEVKQEDKVLLQFKMNWNGEIILETHFDHEEQGFVFKYRGLFKETFVMVNPDGVEMLLMKPHFKWSKMTYEYELTSADQLEAHPAKGLLLMISLHCANYYMAMMMSSMGG